MDYFELVKLQPSLFFNENAILNIIIDQKIITEWEEKKEAELKQKGLPLEWAKIGIVLDDPYNIIVRDLVQFPDGDMRGYGRSIATATLKGGRGVVVLPEYQGKIMLLHQYRHPTRQWHYEVPRGYGEPNTPAGVNARKEIEEETGGQIEELVSLGEFYNNTGWEAASVALFYAKLASVGEANVNEGIEAYVWLTVKELEEWIANEKITDGFTIAAYTKAKLKGLI
ncbi:MAG: NUDIX hydrolase [Anaerolineales bacterium]|nr:NUDIX hydrolase [Anaerolineales bacterium]